MVEDGVFCKKSLLVFLRFGYGFKDVIGQGRGLQIYQLIVMILLFFVREFGKLGIRCSDMLLLEVLKYCFVVVYLGEFVLQLELLIFVCDG